jgi:hypothetical protein
VDEIQQRLEHRPRLTLRLRIAAVFVICALFVTGITAGRWSAVQRAGPSPSSRG